MIMTLPVFKYSIMCTHFVLVNKAGSVTRAQQLGVDPRALLFGAFQPGSRIGVIHQAEDRRCCTPAIWWLFLQQTAQGLKPHPRYFSVNTNYAKLPQRPEFRKTRCIILASQFCESQAGRRPHLLEAADGSVMAFGGLYKRWIDQKTGVETYSASIITLKGHPALAAIHRKSTPLWLAEQDFDAWLDPKTDTRCFDAVMEPTLQTTLRATPIDQTTKRNPVGASFMIEP